MKAFAKLKEISYFLPEQILTNEELESTFPEWGVDRIYGKVGISSRHIADPGQTALDLGIAAAEKIFEEHQIDRSSVDYILFCTESPDYLLPPNACIAQDRLGLKKSCGAFDVTLGCSGFVYGLSIAKGLIESNQAKRVLLITAETYSKYLNRQDKTVRTLFGDAGAAALIDSEPSPVPLISNLVFGTDGSGYKDLIVPASGARRKESLEAFDVDRDGAGIRSALDLYMNGPKVFTFTLGVVPPMVKKCLESANKNVSDIDFFVFHQANRFILDNLQDRCGIPSDKFIVEVEDVGNTVSCTIPIALARALKDGRIPKNSMIMIVGFGVGLSSAAAIINI